MSTIPPTLSDIMAELRAIRSLLESRPARSSSSSTAASTSTSNTSNYEYRHEEEPIPQPSPPWDIARANAHQVHFGKNQGISLESLKDTSLSFYAKEKEPRLDSKGKPFPKRKEDADLENAARTVWHHRRGTLGQPATATTPAPTQAATPQPPPQRSTPEPAKPAASTADPDEDVPF